MQISTLKMQKLPHSKEKNHMNGEFTPQEDYKKAWFVFLLIYIYIFVCNYCAPLFADDYAYAMNWAAQGQHIKSFTDVINSQIHHYMTWGGRSVTHTLAQYFLLLGKPIFNVLNAGIFITLILAIYWHIVGKITLKCDYRYLLFIFASIYICVKSVPEPIFWLIGACNYLWPTTFILLFLLPYRIALTNKSLFTTYNKTFIACLMFLFGIVSGWTNENTAATMLLFTFSVCLLFYKQNKLDTWMILGFLGAIIGFSFLILAPGNKIRFDALRQMGFTFEKAFFNNLFNMSKIILYQWLLWLITIFIFFNLVKKRLLSYNVTILLPLSFISLSILNNAVMLFSPIFPYRASFGSTIYLIIGALMLLKFNYSQYTIKHTITKTMIFLLATYMTITCYITVERYILLYKETQLRNVDIMMQIKENKSDIIIKPYNIYSNRYLYMNDIRSDSETWTNKAFANYLGVKSIRLTEDYHVK